VGITRGALRSAFVINWRNVSPVAGLITAVPVAAVFAVGLALHSPRAAITMAVGANLVAIVSLVGAPRLPLRLAVVDALGLGVSAFVGTWSESQPWLHAALLVPWCFAAGMAVLFGQTQGVLGSQAIVAFVVFGRLAGPVLADAHLGVMVAFGALVEVGALVVLRLPPSLRYQRATVAEALNLLARYATTPAHSSALGALEGIDTAQRVLSPLSLFGRSDDRDLRAIVDQARRARLDFTTLAGLRSRLAESTTSDLHPITDALAAAATTFEHLATGVRHPSRATNWREASHQYRDLVDGVRRQLHALRPDEPDAVLFSQILAHLDALGGQLRSIGHLVERESAEVRRGAWRLDVGWGGLDRSHRSENLALVRDNLHFHSTAMRHAVRLAIAVLAATGLAHWLSLPRGYWVAFAVAVILKPDYSTTLRRGVGRVVGTALGASLAAVLVGTLHPGFAATSVAVAVVATCAYSTWPASFAVSIGLVTSLVLVMLSVGSTDSVGTALDRLLDVALGAAISALTYLAWPSSPAQDVRQSQGALFGSLARYLDEVLRYVTGDGDTAAIVAASRRAHFRFADAQAAVGRSLEEPSATRANPDVERGVLSSGLRILRATHALRFEAERGATTPSSEALTELRQALVATLEHIDDVPPLPAVTPRALYLTAAADLARLGAAASVALNLDEIVNALDTAAHLVTSD